VQAKHKGAWAEAIAKAYLLKMGFEVFENVSAHGPIDFIAMDPDTRDMVKFDVKMASVRRNYVYDGFANTSLRFQRQRTARQKELCVQLLHVTPGGNVLTDVEAKPK
jgi:Holliday junction resolvase-like predicted endonuclease